MKFIVELILYFINKKIPSNIVFVQWNSDKGWYMTSLCIIYSERQIWREKVGDSLGERLLRITDTLNRHDYIPSPPNQSDIDYIYDTNFPDVQPFLFKVSMIIVMNPSS